MTTLRILVTTWLPFGGRLVKIRCLFGGYMVTTLGTFGDQLVTIGKHFGLLVTIADHLALELVDILMAAIAICI